MQQKKLELLAPAGDWERLEMALAYGADAVYLAGNTFGMRSFAGNFSPEELRRAADVVLVEADGAKRLPLKAPAEYEPVIPPCADAVAAVQPLVHWAAYLPPEQGQPKPDELPTAFIAVLQDDNLPGASDVDVGLALGSLTAAAWAHGVGSGIMGAIDRPALTKLLALPDGVRLCYMVALGYPTHASKLVEMQDGSVKYYLDENRGYCVPKRSIDAVRLKTL